MNINVRENGVYLSGNREVTIQGKRHRLIVLSQFEVEYIGDLIAVQENKVESQQCSPDAWCGQQDAFHERKESQLEMLNDLTLRLGLSNPEKEGGRA